MAVINSTDLRFEGNTVYIKSNPAIGILALLSFADDATGEDIGNNIIFNRNFRYSLNGIVFSDWIPLTVPNLTGISVAPTDTLVLEMSYEKVQPLGSDVLDISSVDLTANDQAVDEGYYFQNSIFSNFFGSNDVEVLKWYINVLEKLYHAGLIPQYIERKDEFGNPDDFINFWKAIAKFFAYMVVYARTFQNFNQERDLIVEFLEQRGIKTSVENDLTDLNTLMENYYNEIFKRGTVHVIDDSFQDPDVIDGELLRLIYYKKNIDEFLFNLYKPEHFGWNLGNSSPLHKGLYLNNNINKNYEKSNDTTDVANYPIIGNVANVTLNDMPVLSIGNGGGIGLIGVGNIPMPTPIDYDPVAIYNQFRIKVDPRLDYEISFMIQKEHNKNLTFGFTSFDKDGNIIDSYNNKTGVASDLFFKEIDLLKDDRFMIVKAWAYNAWKPINPNEQTHTHQGNNLILDKNVAYIIPYIHVKDDDAFLHTIKILPIQTPYSRGFLQTKNFISCWLINRNSAYNTVGLKNYISKYLIPYNCQIKLTPIGDHLYAEDKLPDPKYWFKGESIVTGGGVITNWVESIGGVINLNQVDGIGTAPAALTTTTVKMASLMNVVNKHIRTNLSLDLSNTDKATIIFFAKLHNQGLSSAGSKIISLSEIGQPFTAYNDTFGLMHSPNLPMAFEAVMPTAGTGSVIDRINRFSDDVISTVNSISLQAQRYHVFELSFDRSILPLVYIDGVPKGETMGTDVLTGNFGMHKLYLGGIGSATDSLIGDILIYDKLITSSERKAVINMLFAKYRHLM